MPAQINIGLARFLNGWPFVDACWGAVYTGDISFLPQKAPLVWNLGGGSIAFSVVAQHDPARSWIDFTQRNVAGTALGPVLVPQMHSIYATGLATATNTNTLADSTKAWGTNALAGKFLRLRPGAADEHWTRIVSNTATVLTVATATFGAPLVVLGNAYQVHDAETMTLASWRVGTPPDWTGVAVGDLVVALEEPGVIGIVSNTAGAATGIVGLTSNWVGPDLIGVEYAIHRDRTALGLPRFNAGDRAALAMLTRISDRADSLLTYRGALGALSGSQSIPTGGTGTPLSWPAPAYGAAYYNGATPTRIRIPASYGIKKVQIIAHVRWADSAAGRRELWLRKNGSVTAAIGLPRDVRLAGAGQESSYLVSGVIEVADNDYFEVMAFQDSGAGLNALLTETWYSLEVKEAN